MHAVSYSLLLLNTDLHVADLQTRMSRSQFVRNTMTAIQMQLQTSPDPSSNPSLIPAAHLSSSDLTYDDCSSVRCASDETDMRTLTRSKRSNSTASWNSVSVPDGLSPVSSQLGAGPSNGSSQSVHSPSELGTPGRPVALHGRAWEMDMEALLKVSFFEGL